MNASSNRGQDELEVLSQSTSYNYTCARFEVTRGLYRDEPRNFEPCSDDEENTRGIILSPNFRTAPMGEHMAATDLEGPRPAYAAVLQWNRASTLEAETLLPGYHGPHIAWEKVYGWMASHRSTASCTLYSVEKRL
ncbi:hypothetical protein AVEN_169552-1 [Araneus ventricosus]|uniref:Uncharacterized protein n=1 Tax=Araneus ventricosus TaxID=182803 RepID=A0A4Y2T7Y0_ARAVE|nr:hypothetical protein AVEN_258538-1 [Araneus ventricosus]GBN96737.1 hypothetical protein AVEN_169552-1 [Araneus ventricosus]